MSAPFSVRLPSGAHPSIQRHRSILASLPERFRLVDEGDADVVMVCDPSPAGIEGARAFVLDGEALLAPLEALPEVSVPAFRFLPRLTADRSFESVSGSGFSLIDMTTGIERPDESAQRAVLLEQLAILATLTGAEPRLQKHIRTVAGYMAQVAIAGQATIAMLTACVSKAGTDTFLLDAVRPEARLEVSMDDMAIARPARISLSNADGKSQALPVHQNGLRLVWAEVARRLGGETATDDRPFVLARRAIDAFSG